MPTSSNAADGPLVEIRNLRKSFGDHRVLDGISFSVQRGEVIVLLGPSGSGKSTILRCVNFLEPYDEGEVLFDGELVGWKDLKSGKRALRSETEISELRQRIGIVFQSYNLFPHKTALENVMTGPIHVRGMTAAAAHDIAETMLARVDLLEKKNSYPAHLSGGQQQRVAIARALALNPDMMLFDEVTSALDPEITGEVLKAMLELAKGGMTMLVVTHELPFARDVADRIVFLDKGKIVETGSPDQLLKNPKSERLRSFIRRYQGEYLEAGA